MTTPEYNRNMRKEVIHVSETEATNDFSSLLKLVRAGVEIVIEHASRPVAVVRPAEPSVRLLSESLRLAREHGSTATLDGEFGADLEAIVNSRRESLNHPRGTDLRLSNSDQG
jgi:prevent-host-death family protein